MHWKFLIGRYDNYIFRQRNYDPTTGSLYVNRVTIFSSSPQYNLKVTTITHVGHITSNGKERQDVCKKNNDILNTEC